MATVTEPQRVNDIEAALIDLDQAYRLVYGPNLNTWSKGVRGEFLDRQQSRRTMDHETHPLHPRKASAGRRRRHLKQLPFRIHQIAPDAVTVLLAPVWLDNTGEARRVFTARCLTVDGNQVQLPRGGSRRLADLMQGAFPDADWNQPLTWRADSNRLTTWRQRQAAS